MQSVVSANLVPSEKVTSRAKNGEAEGCCRGMRKVRSNANKAYIFSRRHVIHAVGRRHGAPDHEGNKSPNLQTGASVDGRNACNIKCASLQRCNWPLDSSGTHSSSITDDVDCAPRSKDLFHKFFPARLEKLQKTTGAGSWRLTPND